MPSKNQRRGSCGALKTANSVQPLRQANLQASTQRRTFLSMFPADCQSFLSSARAFSTPHPPPRGPPMAAGCRTAVRRSTTTSSSGKIAFKRPGVFRRRLPCIHEPKTTLHPIFFIRFKCIDYVIQRCVQGEAGSYKYMKTFER
jgi:hypothetical protein